MLLKAAAIAGEWKRVALRTRSARILNLLVIAVFGVLVPWRYGFDFFDPFVIFAYSAIGLLLATVVTDLMVPGVSEAPVSTRIFASALHGWTILLVVHWVGIATVNILFLAPRFLHPNWTLAAACTAFTLAGALFVASMGAFLSMLFSPKAARNTLRIAFVASLLAILRGPRLLPPVWQAAIDQQLTTEGLTRIGWIGAACGLVLSTGLIAALSKSE